MAHLNVLKHHLSASDYVLKLLELTGFNNFLLFKYILEADGQKLNPDFETAVLNVLKNCQDQVIFIILWNFHKKYKDKNRINDSLHCCRRSKQVVFTPVRNRLHELTPIKSWGLATSAVASLVTSTLTLKQTHIITLNFRFLNMTFFIKLTPLLQFRNRQS